MSRMVGKILVVEESDVLDKKFAETIGEALDAKRIHPRTRCIYIVTCLKCGHPVYSDREHVCHVYDPKIWREFLMSNIVPSLERIQLPIHDRQFILQHGDEMLAGWYWIGYQFENQELSTRVLYHHQATPAPEGFVPNETTDGTVARHWRTAEDDRVHAERFCASVQWAIGPLPTQIPFPL